MTIDRITKCASVLAIAVLISALSACDSLISFLPDDGDDGNDGIDSTTHIISDLHILEITVAIAESFPPQVFLHIDSYLPDSCTEIHQTTERREGNTFHVQITTKRPKDMACATVITEIEHVVGLGFFDTPGAYKAIVNGTAVEFEID